MSLDTLLVIVMVIAILIAAMAGAFSFFRTPGAYIGIAKAIYKSAFPIIFAHVMKRMDPKLEAEWRKCELRGGKWNHKKRRCE